MSIRLAAPSHALRNRIAFAAARVARMAAANDNSPSCKIVTGDGAGTVPSHQPDVATLNAALRHFARHGIAAAHQARAEAQAAKDAGDDQAFAWWLSICATLDRRMARDLARATR